MNPGRHMSSHLDFFNDVMHGDAAGAEEHRRFYDEYNAVLDMPAEYYLDCVRIVFQQHLLPRGLWQVARQPVTPAAVVERRADDRRGRDGRHLRPRSDARRPRAVHRRSPPTASAT